MCTTINSSLSPVARLAISSAAATYKLYEYLGKNQSFSFQLKTKTQTNQRLFAEAIALSEYGRLDYFKCTNLILKMKEGNLYENLE